MGAHQFVDRIDVRGVGFVEFEDRISNDHYGQAKAQNAQSYDWHDVPFAFLGLKSKKIASGFEIFSKSEEILFYINQSTTRAQPSPAAHPSSNKRVRLLRTIISSLVKIWLQWKKRRMKKEKKTK